MMPGEPKVPLDQLEHEVEQTRANVAQTINELQNQVVGTVEDIRTRLHPDEIRREVKRYVQDSARRASGRIGEKAANHPAAAVALGALALWPVVKLARQVPLPIYVIAAGIGLMRPLSELGSSAASAAGDAAGRLSDQVRDLARPVIRSAGQAQAAVSHAVSQVAESVGDAADSLADAGSRMLHSGERDRPEPSWAYRPYEPPRSMRWRDAAPNGWALALIGIGLGAAAASYVPKMLEQARREEEERRDEEARHEAAERARREKQTRKRKAPPRPRSTTQRPKG